MKLRRLAKCPVHTNIVDECVVQLASKGKFKNSGVLKGLGIASMAKAINWKFVRESLREEGILTIPMGPVFFKQHPKADERAHPEVYLANGCGGKAVGYTSIGYADGIFSAKFQEYMNASAKGSEMLAQELQHQVDSLGITDQACEMALTGKEV